MPGKREVLTLYRDLLHHAYKFDNYNFRSYAVRRVNDAFRANKALNGEAVVAAYNDGIDNLAMLKRQAAVSQMYTFDQLVVEPRKHHA
ncbi:hypothetical protein DIURU_004735 [Diutina rugosa]|uniref:Complex 1 LYR protein domain-containing protein n=1 Tax=Diutina rugosa TaxID=5481 RepID=A0A642UF20_DIURU|nr:uncharacterized protein DIURU_004735 [Diutina rugosa]KAA8897882.1 hypothetical protein DIURU_004735 [Diutina rugosa]